MMLKPNLESRIQRCQLPPACAYFRASARNTLERNRLVERVNLSKPSTMASPRSVGIVGAKSIEGSSLVLELKQQQQQPPIELEGGRETSQYSQYSFLLKFHLHIRVNFRDTKSLPARVYQEADLDLLSSSKWASLKRHTLTHLITRRPSPRLTLGRRSLLTEKQEKL